MKTVIFAAQAEEVHEKLIGKFPVIITGIGKMNAAISLANYLSFYENPRDLLILNIGSCRSSKFPKGEVVSVSTTFNGGALVVQDWVHSDFWHPSLKNAILYTSDEIISDKYLSAEYFNHLKNRYEAFDFEGSALACLAKRFRCKYACLKVIYGDLTETNPDWDLIINELSEKLADAVITFNNYWTLTSKENGQK